MSIIFVTKCLDYGVGFRIISSDLIRYKRRQQQASLDELVKHTVNTQKKVRCYRHKLPVKNT